jgi:transaldolase/glucose-6-phosphate isomerase
MRIDLPSDLRRDVDALLAEWESGAKVARLWDGDASLWTGADESRWRGWLAIPGRQLERREELAALGRDVREAGFEHALVLGMGGSSLCPEVLASSLGSAAGYPRLHVLDSTHPAEVAAREREVGFDRTLFIVSSKSGTTLETAILMRYFASRAEEALGAARAAERFVAITDPGSALEEEARARGFRAVIAGVPSIGGRYSALSAFGMAPGAAAGLDVEEMLRRGERMAAACAPSAPGPGNPGLELGLVLGAAHERGHDKLTLFVSPRIAGLGAWLEQLVAESTGKQGRGIVPVDAEPPAEPDSYGDDRLFVQVRLGEDSSAQDPAVDALARAGRPVVRIDLDDPLDLGAQFYLWEFATAVAGAVIGVNPFDQPDVEATKARTRELTAEFERSGALPPAVASDSAETVSAELARIAPPGYLALLAYLPRDPRTEAALGAVRAAVRDRTRAATTVGFGPRYLHSTGQAHKGGPPGGLFVQVTADHEGDVDVPGAPYTFGVVNTAQARGDFDVLAERGRRVLRLHLGDMDEGLARLRVLVGGPGP